MSDPFEPPRFGPQEKLLHQLSDAELHEEAQRRRRARGAAPAPQPPSAAGLDYRQRAQYLANLELEPGAGAQQIREAYDRLVARFQPASRAGDPDKRSAAEELLRRLRVARDALLGNQP